MGCIQKYKKHWNYELNAAVILLLLPVRPVPLMHQISKDANNLLPASCRID